MTGPDRPNRTEGPGHEEADDRHTEEDQSGDPNARPHGTRVAGTERLATAPVGVLAALGFVIVPSVYAAAVLTSVGQRVEDAALGGVRESDLFGRTLR